MCVSFCDSLTGDELGTLVNIKNTYFNVSNLLFIVSMNLRIKIIAQGSYISLLLIVPTLRQNGKAVNTMDHSSSSGFDPRRGIFVLWMAIVLQASTNISTRKLCGHRFVHQR